ncbi:hypothetical protein AB1Y20_012474 [Prymnesium parvum]|uniref:tRNA-guanine(15) transglycosylase-like domain-containing protein n=1 Tax=Prymnesium parvum TaxID=97485 RepID=A0AB34IIJ3_PRYPA
MTSSQSEVDAVREQIAAAGVDLRRLRSIEGHADEASSALARLLQLKARYEELTGDEYRKKRVRSPAAPAADPRRQKQPRLPRAAADETPPDPMACPPPAASFPAWAAREYFRFEVVHRSAKPGSRARVGRLVTPHGVVDTPAFVPVGTNAALKALDERHAREAGVQLTFCNTYHLLVHPGPRVVGAAGGLHKYMNHEGALITDSGGFQVFSLAQPSEDDGPELKSRNKRAATEAKEGGAKSGGSLVRVSERGAVFRSYHDGRTIELTPESSVEAQKLLGADIIIPLDELPPYHITPERLHASVRLSHRWMARSLRTHLANPQQQAMYAVVHGGTDQTMRRESAEYLASLPFDGFAVGGSLGKDRAEMLELLAFLMPLLPEDKPNHLLGIADPESCAAVVPFGVDTMDSCNPTRIARHGLLLSTAGAVKIKQLKYEADFGPIDPECETVPHSRAYLHHLFKQHEPLFMTLASQHNLIFMNKLMADIRRRILADEI